MNLSEVDTVRAGILQWLRELEAAISFKRWRRLGALLPSSGIWWDGRRQNRRALLERLDKQLVATADVEIAVNELQLTPRRGLWASRMQLTVSWRDFRSGEPHRRRLSVLALSKRAGQRPSRLRVTRVEPAALPAPFRLESASAPASVRSGSGTSTLVVTVASYAHPALEDLKASCRRFGVDLKVIGRGAPWHGSTYNKLRDFGRFLRFEASGYTHVLYTDAFDSILARPLADIMSAFEAEETPLLMSAEACCYPGWPGQAESDYPPAPTPYRFLNAGGFLGRIDYLLDVFDRLDVENVKEHSSDQGWWAGVFVGGKIAMKLDYHCRVFQCLHGALADVAIDDRIVNRLTGTAPSVIHANGREPLSAYLEHVIGAPSRPARFVRRARSFLWRKLVLHEFVRP